MENSGKDTPEMVHSRYLKGVEPEAEWEADVFFLVHIFI